MAAIPECNQQMKTVISTTTHGTYSETFYHILIANLYCQLILFILDYAFPMS